jgi:TRAP transporter TAXI family solute receptor
MKRRFGVFLLALCVGVVLALAVAIPVQVGSAAEPRTTIAMLEWPTGYGPPEQAVILSRLITEHSKKIRLAAQETPGYVYNLKVMAKDKWRWKRHIMGTNPGARWLAENAIKPFFEEPIKQEWKLLWGEAISLNGNFVTLDPKIKTPADFKGKRIALGLKTQTNWGGFTTVILEHGFGVTNKNASLQYLGPKASMDALLDGRVDVAVYGTLTTVGFDPVQPGPTLRHLASSGRKFYYINIGRKAVEGVNKKVGTPFLTATLPAGMLPGQTKQLELFGDVDQKTVHPSFSADLAYELTKAVLKYAPQVGKYFAYGELWKKPELFVLGFNEKNTHPGSMRAFKEAGIWNKRRDSL